MVSSCKNETATSTVSTNLPDTVYFSEHVASIIYTNCTPCHRPSGPAPFTLTSFKDVAGKASTIKEVTATRYMPPWPADPTYTHFVGERQLSQQDIDMIGKWVDQGKLRGDATKEPDVPQYPEGSQLGKPDLVVKMENAYLVKGDNTDKFLIMKIPFELPNDTFIRLIEVVAGNTKVVHHINGHVVRYEPGTKASIYNGARVLSLEEYTDKEAFIKMDIPNDDGTFPTLVPLVANYLPGVQAQLYPDGIGGFRMTKKGAILLDDIHYGPTPKDEWDQTYFNIFFDSAAPERPTREIQLGTNSPFKVTPPLVIPPNEVKTFYTQATLDFDMTLLTINPHMHLLGKKFLAYAISPQGDTTRLIRINNWNFRWQYFYTFPHPVVLKKGTTIYCEATFDNTPNNPDNPYDPPRLIRDQNGSMKTTDEMFQFIMTYLPYLQGDEEIDMAAPYKELQLGKN